MKRIIAASKAPYDTLWRLVAETGIRRGEACGLNVADVDFDKSHNHRETLGFEATKAEVTEERQG